MQRVQKISQEDFPQRAGKIESQIPSLLEMSTKKRSIAIKHGYVQKNIFVRFLF
jgi:hypothetical protein